MTPNFKSHRCSDITSHKSNINASRGGSRNSFGGPNQGPQSKVKGGARIEGAKCSSIEGEARVEGAKRPRIEGEARTEGEAREKAGEGSGEGARRASPKKIFEKSNLRPFIFVHI